MEKYILFIFGLFFSTVMFSQKTKTINHELLNHYPSPKVDKQTELLSIVFRLAGNFEYNTDTYRSYVTDIHNHFDKYKDHPLITFATELSNKSGVAFDAVMFMAIYL